MSGRISLSSSLSRCSLFLPVALVLLVAGVIAPAAHAGGQLETVDFTAGGPGPIPGSIAVDVVPIQWDPRCVPVSYRLNTAVLPNADVPLDATQAQALLQASFDAWNEIPTSFIEMSFVGQVNRPRTGPFDVSAFDFVNEVNFLAEEGQPVAASPSVSLNEDTTLVPGDDVDGDGDSDVFDPAVEGVEVCTDVDGDGDVEFPAGFYEAGSILDNDVYFNNVTILWTTGAPNAVNGELDLAAVSTHEFGHSHGLSHSALNQTSTTDGTSPTMINGVPSTDPASQLSLRTLAEDDQAWSSFVYPEGSASTGAGALQPGDVAFDDAYGIIRGEITLGDSGLPAVGSNVFSIREDTGEIVSSHYVGRTRLVQVPEGFLDVLPDEPDFHLVDGTYSLPVLAGTYNVAVEPLDGSPTFPGAIGNTTIIGGFFDVQGFNEEVFPRIDPRLRFFPRDVRVRAGRQVSGVDHVTRVDTNLDPFDTVGIGGFLDYDGLGFSTVPPGFHYAVRFPKDELLAQLEDGLILKSAAFRNRHVDLAVTNVFPRAGLYLGTVGEDGTAVVDFDHPLAEQAPFVGQDNDFSPLYFDWPLLSTLATKLALYATGKDAFLVLELPASFPGLNGLPPLMGLDAGQEVGLLGRSYFSLDGGATFQQDEFANYMFRLVGEGWHGG